MLGRWVRSYWQEQGKADAEEGSHRARRMGFRASFGDCTLVALEQLPPKFQPKPHMEDLKKLLMAGCQPGSANLHLAQAKCKLFPEKDPLSIYQKYGIEGGRE